jgi:hypothetical protein
MERGQHPTPVARWGAEAVRLPTFAERMPIRAAFSSVDLQRAAKGNLVQNMQEALAAVAARNE